MSKPGTYLERVVSQLEQSISPELQVEHDAWLSVIGSPSGAKRQCDITLRSKGRLGALAIIEVQDRSSAVDVNTFDGWQQKKKDVGAQFLICVSKKPFPGSVQEKALLAGPSVRLVTYHEDNKLELPIDISQLGNNLRCLRFGEGDVWYYFFPEDEFPKEKPPRSLDEHMIIFQGQSDPVPLVSVFPGDQYRGVGNGVFVAKIARPAMCAVLPSGTYRTPIIRVRTKVEVFFRDYSTETWAYEQQGDDSGVLAWTLVLNPSDSSHPTYTAPIICTGPGEYEIGTLVSSRVEHKVAIHTPLGATSTYYKPL